MVVDDSAMNRKIVRRTLESYLSANKLNGCQVVIEEADDGLTAIEKYKAITSDNNGSVDLIVLGKSTLS
jgi:CheY-like chemotaxis protein